MSRDCLSTVDYRLSHKYASHKPKAKPQHMRRIHNHRLKRRVTFHEVRIRDYPITLSINPASRFGPAIELGWDYNTETVLPIDEFEKYRNGKRRTLQKLYLYLPTRVFRLKNLDFTDAEISQAICEKDQIVKQRDRSNASWAWSPIDTVRREWRAVRRHRAVKRVVNLERRKRNQISQRHGDQRRQ